MTAIRSLRAVQTGSAAVAILFGLATILAGGRVLSGSDPGYVVFRPLLIYNTVMGLAYLGAGLTIWREVVLGRFAAAAIFFLNLLVLMAIVVIHQSGGAVAVDSLRAMTVRTVVWLGLALTTSWLVRHPPSA